MARKLRYLHPKRWSATLGKFLAASEGKKGPPWGQPHFSYRFSGVPPVQVYEAMGLL